MHIFLLMLTLLVTVSLASEEPEPGDLNECKPETCAATSCVPAPITCPKGYKIGPGGFCGCCQGCLKVKHFHESCQVITGPIWPPERCDLGLWCDEGRCIKEWTK